MIAFVLSQIQTEGQTMYNIEFYKNSSGTSKLWDFLESLRPKLERNDYLMRKETNNL